MNSDIVISVIVPIYNAEKYLRECLDSIVNQTLKNIEIICVNDGSKDSSLNILKEYQEQYSNITIINQENKGTIATRKIGLAEAKGQYITWVDNDDFIEKTMYEKMYKKALDEDLDIVICDYNFYPNSNTDKQKWYKPYDGEKIDYKFIQHNTVLWNKIVKKELIDKLDIVNLIENMGEGVYALLLINASKIGTIDEAFYNYRVGHGSQSRNLKKIKWFENTVKHQENKLNYVKNNSYSDEWIELFTYNYLYYACLLMIIGAYNSRKDIYYKYKKIIKENKLFSSKYDKYLKNNITFLKILFLKIIGQNNYWLTKIISRFLLK